MRTLLIFLMACGEPKGPIIGVQSGDDTGGSNIDAGLVFIEGGTYPLGEDDLIPIHRGHVFCARRLVLFV